MNESWHGPSDLVPAPNPPSPPGPRAPEHRALVEVVASSSAELWSEVLERLDHLQDTQRQLVRAIGDLTGLLRRLAEQAPPEPLEPNPGPTRPDPRVLAVVPPLPDEPPPPPPAPGQGAHPPLGFRVRAEDLLGPGPERTGRHPRVPPSGAEAQLPPPPKLPPPPTDAARPASSAPPPPGLRLPPPPPAGPEAVPATAPAGDTTAAAPTRQEQAPPATPEGSPGEDLVLRARRGRRRRRRP
ncbi:hypothetical protein [Aciditerrimonas ferrireducens]|uniref:hypothetical protein n=1 Tax=Aciditerrimonas ferrireducens TaxID=667306 RepID=UPI002006A3DC|nr:hypothetical protein [Aciditerrimonas ferrireducens]MCK4176549.1 hypothetical protein [Aciditerrimonas ferrireducens]